MSAVETQVKSFMEGLEARNPHEPEFHQAAHEVAESVMGWYLDHDAYTHAQILERVSEPDRIISFRVVWEDDQGKPHVQKAYRVQFNKALGPYKGGLRFHRTVNQSVLKFLGFEQIFKNSLTGLPMGGGKGGSNFDPRGRSDREVMRFCQSLMLELSRHIGADLDVPAGDIGVGAREIGYLFGAYTRIRNEWTGVLTGKGLGWGGSNIRTEATGYGCVYFTEKMLEQHGDGIEGKRVAISGSGNVAIYGAERAMLDGAKIVTLSDSGGFVHIPDGLTQEQLAAVKDLKEVRRGRISELADKFDGITYHADSRPWGVDCDVAMPCATQNELDASDAEKLIKNGVRAVAEGANMPTTADAIELFQKHDVLMAPGKASNAGGVGTSGLEMSQNSLRLSWSREEVDQRLRGIMETIHASCVEYGSGSGNVDYVKGANIAGFKKVADAMLAFGLT